MADTPLSPKMDGKRIVARSEPTDPLLREALRKTQDQEADNLDARASMLQATRPVDVVHYRHQLQRWWSVPGEWQRRLAMQGRRPIEGAGDQILDSEGTQRWTAEAFEDAELYWVAPEMCDLVATMAPSIPDTLPQPPCYVGFVMFSKSLLGTDAATGGHVYTTAFLWAPVETTLGPCIALETYSWRDLVFAYQSLDEKMRGRFREVLPCRLMSTGGSEWPTDLETSDFSRLTAEDEIMEQSMLEDRRLLSTFWALASQKITLEERWEPDRRTRRQAMHWGYKNPLAPVRVIRLREPATRSRSGAGSDVEWSHRWIVGEHWRNQWYPASGQHRPKLIHAYQKGPVDKPLVLRETVRALVR